MRTWKGLYLILFTTIAFSLTSMVLAHDPHVCQSDIDSGALTLQVLPAGSERVVTDN